LLILDGLENAILSYEDFVFWTNLNTKVSEITNTTVDSQEEFGLVQTYLQCYLY